MKRNEKNILFKLGFESIPLRRTYWIGILQGTWKNMGRQYGQRAAKDIRKNFEEIWEQSVLRKNISSKYLWPQKDLSIEKKAEYVLSYTKRGTKELSYLSTELIDFMKGIAEGAAEELNKSIYSKVCSNFDKIAFVNYAWLPHYHPKALLEDDCNGFWVKGEASKTRDTFATNHSQGIFSKSGSRTVSYVAIPKDPKARVFWSRSNAGRIGCGAGGPVLNDRGVCYLSAGAQYHDGNLRMDETLAPGIDEFILAFYAVVFSKSAKEATSKLTVGTKEYRSLTGRQTVLRKRGCVIAFADAKDCFAVEQNARNYAIRNPGYLGEKNNNYLVFANHFMFRDGSYDEKNVWNSDNPMFDYTRSQYVRGIRYPLPNTTNHGSSYWRFWSGMWMLKNNYGEIDKEMVLRELTASHIGYDEDGNKYEPDSHGIPTVGSTFCDHQGYQTKHEPLGQGGSRIISVFILNKLEALWVEAWPCHFKDKEWNYISLKPFKEYRKLLWGY